MGADAGTGPEGQPLGRQPAGWGGRSFSCGALGYKAALPPHHAKPGLCPPGNKAGVSAAMSPFHRARDKRYSGCDRPPLTL